MINYYKTAYGLKLLFRVGGSCVYRSFVPGIVCLFTVLLIRLVWRQNDNNFDDDEIAHPYVTGVVIASLNFLLVFRVQIGYARYWEAAGAVFQFLSRMMDSAVHGACYHMQCDHYDHIKPPSYYDYPELNQFNLTRARERYKLGKGGSQIRLQRRAVGKSIESVPEDRVGAMDWYSVGRKKNNHTNTEPKPGPAVLKTSATAMHGNKAHDPTTLEGAARLDGNYGKLFDDGKATYYDPNNPEKLDPCGFAGVQGGRTPPLFLQELAHLTSLCTAVALSTLRNDIEGAESPLDIYVPGSKWPDVDPNMSFFDNYNSTKFGFSTYQKLKFFLGQARTFEERTSYNASHPMPVLGGVSDGEIRLLQQARGPYAKTQLCWYWLSEFISREHLAGSLGNIGPPIISRIMQFLGTCGDSRRRGPRLLKVLFYSTINPRHPLTHTLFFLFIPFPHLPGDADVQYNHARKIMFIPFPFVHAQLSVVYTLVAIPIVALLFEQYCEDVYIGCVFAFLTMTVLAAVHEVGTLCCAGGLLCCAFLLQSESCFLTLLDLNILCSPRDGEPF